MRAVVITQPGGPEVLEIMERPIPSLSKDEVLIHIKAAGVNRPDISQRKGSYPPPPGASPDIPGLEVAGVIESVGADVQRWTAGDRVCALLSGGGYAEYAAVAEGQCLPIPPGWDYDTAAGLPETIFTVWQNVFQRGHLAPGEHFLVHGGSGGIGITAIQLAKAFGAIVFTTAGSADKCSACQALGADQCVNYKDADFEAVFNKTGVDVILDMIGGEYFSKHIRILREDGRLLFINTMKGNKTELDIGAIMKKRLVITGSMLRGRSVLFKTELAREIEEKVWPLLADGRFKAVIDQKFSLSDAAQAHARMESSDHIGKIILINE